MNENRDPRDDATAKGRERPGWLPDTPNSLRVPAGTTTTWNVSPQDMLAPYHWVPSGTCTRCGVKNRFVTRVGAARVAAGRSAPFMMCAGCILEQEEDRLRRARHRRKRYVPGRIGKRG